MFRHALARLWLVALLSLPTAASADAAPAFQAETLAEGVHLFHPERADDPARVNSLVVEIGDALLVVGAQPTPASATELIAEIEARLAKPIRFVVFPHSHAEAAAGASAFPVSALRVASRGFATAMENPEREFEAEARARGGAGLTRPAADLILDARATLPGGGRELELVPYADRHSPGDMIVHVAPGIVFAGAILFPDRDPYAGDADIDRWIAALSYFVRTRSSVVIPLRGGVQDSLAIRTQRDALTWLRGRVEIAVGDGLSAEEIRERLLADEGFAERFDRDGLFPRSVIDRTVEATLAGFLKRRPPQ